MGGECVIISLEEAKLYLRVDGNEEDTLITQLILSAEDICEGILRYPLTDLEVVPESLKQALLYAVANMYENRESLNIKEVIDVMLRLLLPYRRDGW